MEKGLPIVPGSIRLEEAAPKSIRLRAKPCRGEGARPSLPGPSACGRIGELDHPRVPGEERPHRLPLNADPPAVNNPHGRETRGLRIVEIPQHNLSHIARRKPVQIEDVLQRQLDDGCGGELLTLLGRAGRLSIALLR